MRRVRVGPGTRGFTLLETKLVLAVILLAGVLLFSVLAKIRHQGWREKLGADFHGIAAEFEKYHASTGRWPETPARAQQLIDDAWEDGSPFGGHYGWVPPAGPGRPGMIALTAFIPDFPLTLTRGDLLAIDGQIDDGDLATGRLRTGFNGWPVYLVGVGP